MYKITITKAINNICLMKFFREHYGCSLLDAKNLANKLPHQIKSISDKELKKLCLELEGVVEFEFEPETDNEEFTFPFLEKVNHDLVHAQEWYQHLDPYHKKLVNILILNERENSGPKG